MPLLAPRSHSSSLLFRRVLSAALLLALAPVALAAQGATPAATPGAKKALTIDDYGKWRSIDGASIAGDGGWVVYGLKFANALPADGKPVLRLRNLRTNAEIELANASQAQFSPDSRWLAYLVEPPAPTRSGVRSADSTAAPASTPTSTPPVTPPVTPPTTPPPGTPPVAPVSMPTGTPPAVPAITPPGTTPAPPAAGAHPATPPRRYELRELTTGRTIAFQDIQSVAFSPTSTHAVLRHRPATAAGAGASTSAAGGAPGGGAPGGAGGAGAVASNAPRGVDVLVHSLETGRTQFLGSVGDIAFNKTGTLLAYTVDASVRDGNGLFVLDLPSGRTDVIDNDSLRYTRLTWNDRGTGVAVLKGRDVERLRERDNRLLVVPDVTARTSVLFDASKATGFPNGFMVSDRAPLAFSDDGARVFFGTIGQSAAPDTARRRSTDSIADVDVWRTQDERVQSLQMNTVDADRNRTYRQAFDVAAQRFILLADSSMRDLELAVNGPWAVGRDGRAYLSDYKQPAFDYYRVDTRTGARRLMFKGVLANGGGLTPDGRFYLYWNNAKWNAFDMAAATSKILGGGEAPSFVDMEEDHVVVRPAYGIAGYTTDSSAVVVQNRFDLWLLPLDGTAARNLTNGVGARDRVVYRYVRTQPLDSTVKRGARVAREIDLTQPLTLSMYGEFTKKAGFARLYNGALKTLVYTDAAYSNPTRATNADRYLFTRQTFSAYPDLQVAGADMADATKVSNANPQHAEYMWGRRVLFDYTTRRGDKLQGILALPDDYGAGQKRPMLVTFYEKNSQTMHRYPMPSYITGMGAMPVEALSRGYITMLPDVAFHTGSSHSDMLDAVEAATKKVIAMGYADPKHIGVHGHSYGGEGAAFIATRSKMFAAVGMGAGVTDLYTDFSQSWGWTYQVQGGSGANAHGYYMTGQGRWGFSPWDKPDVYRFESALTHAPRVSSPVLIMHGTADPTVSFTEGMNFYSALRYLKKDAYMLAYPNEGHGLRGFANRKDLTTRYFQFFDHYLRGAPAPKWMTDGVPFVGKAMAKDAK
ncbi:prolyl oligopeptidase family serine peptidase [Gemmatimonas sp.]|uniref:S9 family peptidase n=1 Tax=Gemmatimonas sp. TaxID=1962908 RepID=UPI003983C0E4